MSCGQNESGIICSGVFRNSQGGWGRKSEGLFFFFQFFKWGPAQKIEEKMMLPTKKVAKYSVVFDWELELERARENFDKHCCSYMLMIN